MERNNNDRRGHSHRWNVFQVKNSFEAQTPKTPGGTVTYLMVEYAFMVCVCGTVQKSRVEENPNALEEALNVSTADTRR